jgi:hypothetical protein
MRSKVFRLSADAADRRCFYYFLMAVIVIWHETTATARCTSPFIVRAFFNDTITVAVWTRFHVRYMRMLPHPSNGRAAMGGMMQMAVLFAGASPLYPRKRTFRRAKQMSAMGQ